MADGLFLTPEMARQAAMERGMLSSAQMAQLPLLDQVAAMGGNAGTMIGSSLGGLFGGRSAFELENEARMQEYQQQKAAEAEKLRQEQALAQAEYDLDKRYKESQMKPKPSDVKTLIQEQAEFEEGSPQWTIYENAIKKATLSAPTNTNLPQIVKLQQYRDSLASGDPRRVEVQKQIDKLGAPATGTEITLQMPGGDKPKAIPQFRADVQTSIKPYRQVVDAADTVITGIDLGLKEGNFAAAKGAALALVKAFGDGQVSRVEAINAGADPSLIGGGIDYVNQLFTGTPSKDTMNKIKQTAEALKKLNNKKLKTELEIQKALAKEAGYTEKQIDLLFSDFKEEDSDVKQERTVVNTGVEKSTGRRVVKYSDGSTEYAD